MSTSYENNPQEANQQQLPPIAGQTPAGEQLKPHAGNLKPEHGQELPAEPSSHPLQETILTPPSDVSSLAPQTGSGDQAPPNWGTTTTHPGQPERPQPKNHKLRNRLIGLGTLVAVGVGGAVAGVELSGGGGKDKPAAVSSEHPGSTQGNTAPAEQSTQPSPTDTTPPSNTETSPTSKTNSNETQAPTGDTVSVPAKYPKQFNYLDKPSTEAVDGSVDSSNLTQDQRALLKTLATKGFYPAAIAGNYSLEHFTDKGLPENTAEQAVFFQLCSDALTILNTHNPQFYGEMTGKQLQGDGGTLNNIIDADGDAFWIIEPGSLNQDETGWKKLSTTRDGEGVTYSGDVMLAGFMNKLPVSDPTIKDLIESPQPDFYSDPDVLISSGANLKLTATFTVNPATGKVMSMHLTMTHQ